MSFSLELSVTWPLSYLTYHSCFWQIDDFRFTVHSIMKTLWSSNVLFKHDPLSNAAFPCEIEQSLRATMAITHTVCQDLLDKRLRSKMDINDRWHFNSWWCSIAVTRYFTLYCSIKYASKGGHKMWHCRKSF